jgi:hypothetical protein
MRRRRKKKTVMIMMKMSYKKEEQKVEDLLASGAFIERNKRGSYITPTNEMHNFLKLYVIFNCCCLLHVPNLVGSSSRRQLYTQCGMFYMHRCNQSGG